MTAQPENRDTVDDISRIHVRSNTGEMIPLSAFATTLFNRPKVIFGGS